MVMVSLNPHDLPSLLRIRETADAGEKIPVFAFEAPEVEVRKDVAEQDQLAEVHLIQQLHRIFGTAYVRAKMQVREDQRVAG
jgi:hypothetical protein